MQLREDQASGLTLVALALFVAWENRAYPLGSLQEPGPGYTPLLIAIFLGLTGMLIVLRGGASPRLAGMKWPEGTRAAVIIAACAAATYVLESIGYRITIAALLVFFLGVLERRPPLAVAAVAVGFSLLSWYLIGDVLRVPLPRGPWGW
ncbi:MAG TPA: tripartite tricarboxylate transporter TctB family protein [Burkholderiales bacterium]|nr:tripartite tricarboxylate transporter TctB family protein [Burkholderiales bacterium]